MMASSAPPSVETALLLALAVPLAVAVRTDLAERRIPDMANLAIALLGLAHGLALDPARLAGRLFDAAVIGLLLLALRAAYRRLRGVAGLGLGDVKFLAAATLWTGLSGATLLLLLASLAAIAWVGLVRLAGRPVGRSTRIAFGPFLAAGFVCVLVLDAAARAGS